MTYTNTRRAQSIPNVAALSDFAPCLFATVLCTSAEMPMRRFTKCTSCPPINFSNFSFDSDRSSNGSVARIEAPRYNVLCGVMWPCVVVCGGMWWYVVLTKELRTIDNMVKTSSITICLRCNNRCMGKVPRGASFCSAVSPK